MINKLRRKFIILAMCAVFAALFIIIGVINIINYANVMSSIDDVVSVLKEGGGAFIGPGWPPYSELPYQTRYFTVVLNGNGEVVMANTAQIAAVTPEQAAEYAQDLFAKEKADGFVGVYRYSALVIEHRYLMYIFVDCTKDLDNFRNFLLISSAVGAGGFVLALLPIIIFSRKIVKPVAESYDKQKRFITDAGHEIKTPLTIIGADAEVIEMTYGKNEWSDGIKSEIKRLTSLTEKLVFLARMDEPNRKMTVIEFNISDSVEESVKPFEAVAASKGISIHCDIEKNLSYSGDEGMIRQLTELLVDNAVKYSSGDVSVKLAAASNKIHLVVSNPCDDLKDGDLDYLFERFRRGDASHNSGTGGHGIGLSVAQTIVAAHKGKISANKRDGIVAFSVVL